MSLFQQPTFYITNDVERALWPGWENDPNYYIVTYRNPYSEYLLELSLRRSKATAAISNFGNRQGKIASRNARKDINLSNLFLVDGKKGSTEELMKHVQAVNYIKSITLKVGRPNIIVFKPTVEVEEYSKKVGWRLLNPSSRFAEQFEEKIAQTVLFKKLRLRTPKTVVTTIGRLSTSVLEKLGFPCVMQFNLGHTGEGTYFITQYSDLKPFQQQFPNRPVRVSEFIRGVPVTVNGVVGKRVYSSAPSLQITGVPELTPLPFATVGNDWTYVTNSKLEIQNSKLRKIVIKIGNELKKKGYKGAFGVDVILGSDGKLYVIEVNARQVNSCVYESELQRTANSEQRTGGETTMELHFKCLLGRDSGKERLPAALEGAQVFVRVQKDMRWRRNIKPNNNGKFFYFSKLNKGDDVKRNVEVLRVQSLGGMVGTSMSVASEVLLLSKKLI